MIKLIVLFAVGVFTRQAYCDAPEKIVGGNYAYAGQFPHQGSMQMYGKGNHFCGCSIISATHCLTAAHCVEGIMSDFSQLEIVAGITQLGEDGSRHRVKCIRMHPQYSNKFEDAWMNDIAVITVRTPFNFNNNNIKPIRLASVNHLNGGKRGITSGFGKTETNSNVSYYLKWVAVNILSSNQCVNAHNNPRPKQNNICTYEAVGHGICQGDSGGPLVIDGELCGVTSWNVPCARGIPDVFTNVYPYVGFVQESQRMCS